jgi:hypothetical protein
MGWKSFVVGGMIGFCIGLYQGYNYAIERVPKPKYEQNINSVLEEKLKIEYCKDTYDNTHV